MAIVDLPITLTPATLSPQPDAATFGRYALLGIYVGFIPVGLGLLWYPSCAGSGAAACRRCSA